MSQNSKDVRIDPFLHGRDKFKNLKDQEEECVSDSNKEKDESRIDIIGQNGNTGDHYE